MITKVFKEQWCYLMCVQVCRFLYLKTYSESNMKAHLREVELLASDGTEYEEHLLSEV